MISLKKYIDAWIGRSDGSDPGNHPEPKLPGLAVAPVAVTALDVNASPARQWAEQALQRLEANQREIGEIIDVMTRAVHSVTARDERCAREVVGIAQRLRSVANLKALARIRQAIVDGANSLTTCAEHIAEDGRDSLRLVATQVEDYRSRLDIPENVMPDLAPPEPIAGKKEDDPNRKSAAEQWAERASQRLGANRRELREIMFVIERAVESVTARDERYASEVGGIAQRLRSIAGLRSLDGIRHGIIDNANSLTACVERISEDSRESLRRLAAEVKGHRSRLESPEQLSSLDLVITDRRRFEEHLSAEIGAGDRFCLILIALNDLKRVKNRFGRAAGDDLLKQFALELRTLFPTAHLVTRCGEDEFAVIITTGFTEAKARVHRIRRTALGQYKVNSGAEFVVVGVDAAIGVVEWDGAENSQGLLDRGYGSAYS
jgi:diguanylate cyclase (GGDEF)-like protein